MMLNTRSIYDRYIPLDSFRRDSPSSNTYKIHKTFQHYVGKIPQCDSFRVTYKILVFKVLEADKVKFKYVVLGCGHSLICEQCGKISAAKKYFRVRSLLVALSSRFPDSEMASIVFTIPHEHFIHKFPTRNNLNIFFRKVRQIIKKVYPGCPNLSVLHTWSSSDPNNRHIHIHCLIFGIRPSARLWHLYYPDDIIKSMWQKSLDYPYDINLHMQYWKIKNMRKTIHCLRYTLRSPIIDFLKKGNLILTKEFIENVDPLIRFQRMRWYGWMSNRLMKKTLTQFSIVLVDQHPEIKYEFISLETGWYNKYWNHYETESGLIIEPSEILKPETFIKKYFFQVRGPPD